MNEITVFGRVAKSKSPVILLYGKKAEEFWESVVKIFPEMKNKSVPQNIVSILNPDGKGRKYFIPEVW